LCAGWSNMSLVKLIIVAGNGGARADFIAGWLGLLPNFINSYWNIDPATGCSIGCMGNLREIDREIPVEIAVRNQQLTLSPAATTTWAVACHGNQLDINDYQEHINNESVKFLSIDTGGAEKNRIAWDFVVKTYLSDRRGLDWARRSKHWVVDDSIDGVLSDEKRVAKVRQLLTNLSSLGRNVSLPNSFSSTTINYVELFQPGGSYYLCNQLNIEASNTHHKIWDFMIQLADAPDNITVWGVEWKKQDYFSN
jgi:hypothetical protein